jgi:putative N6-adenine-specific DNA methylase
VKLVAKTFHGLEQVLAGELEALGATNINVLKRAVSFDANKELLYRSNLQLRTAIRILQPLTTFKARNDEELYRAVKAYDWSPYLRDDQTLAIDPVVFSRFFTHSKYVALKVKDAICDQFRDKSGKRPSVDLQRPNLMINVHVAEDQFTLSMDSSGQPLNRRGYRTKEHPAPINEVLAAGMVMLSGYDGSQPFLDPMCGSGTIVMEATMIAARMAPNLKRKEFGFMRWNNYDESLWKKIFDEAQAQVRTPPQRINGSDMALSAIDVSRHSALDFGLKQYIDFEVAPFNEVLPKGKNGIAIMNPPYDERMKSKDIVMLYTQIGDQLKQRFSGWNAWVISSNFEALKVISLKPAERHTLFNGSLECRVHKFDLYEGTKKRRVRNAPDHHPSQS